MVADGVTEEETVANSIEGAGAEEEVRCIKKVMQVSSEFTHRFLIVVYNNFIK